MYNAIIGAFIEEKGIISGSQGGGGGCDYNGAMLHTCKTYGASKFTEIFKQILVKVSLCHTN